MSINPSEDWKGEHLIRCAHIDASDEVKIDALCAATLHGPLSESVVRRLASHGRCASQIAQDLGVSIPRISAFASRRGIQIPDGRSMRRKR